MSNTEKLSEQKGFTLIELMIVLAILAILVSVAMPAYQNSIIRTSRNDAKGSLQGFSQAMEQWFLQNNTYLGAAAGGADTGAPSVFPAQSPIDGAARYNLTISVATASTYTLRATPVVGSTQDGDGFLQITHTGARGWDRNDNNAVGAGEDTWED